MNGPHGFRIERLGNGVTDLDAVRPLYEALGFAASAPFDLGTALGPQSELPGSPLVIQIARRDGFNLELVQHGGARPAGRPPVRRPMNLLGFTHLALAVDDIDRVAAIVREHGGVAYDFTRSGTSLCCADPSGLRLLLLGEDSPLRAVPHGSAGIAVDHAGICVADCRRSAAFYTAIGFREGERADLGTTVSAAAELDDVPLCTQRLQLGPYTILLQQWGGARDAGVPVRLPLNRVGELIHFGTHCEDFEAMLDLVVAAGGTVVDRTRGQFPPPGVEVPGMDDPHGWVFVLDPNGVEIEVVGPQ